MTFADRGPGIPACEYCKVFRRFYRLEASRTTPGNGLGLALVVAVVELHGGRIDLGDNQPGLKVTIGLPPQISPRVTVATEPSPEYASKD